ncbi:hypothetical protein AQ794_16725 [Burkholderia pseudomallei]|nr:hypothetical protein BGI47_04495 [Burkholderia pseudomallei]APZ24155.1 hypothetical protein BGI46_04495 [Burkholderia pseudomallei]KIX65192.1 hypothetical protein SZ30_25175 [Burkholderia pseudomallei]OMR16163.1 hypothetical protein AQ717_10535 [Burkholderia pseudomallei]OMR51158.1 hypothetical protein AQ726_19000 [Burkholderia pseudomallei]
MPDFPRYSFKFGGTRRSQLSCDFLQLFAKFRVLHAFSKLNETCYRHVAQPGQTVILKCSKNIECFPRQYLLLYEFSRFSLCAKLEVVPMHGRAEHWLTIKLLSVLCKVVLRA